MQEKFFIHNDILESSLQAYMLRDKVIQNNIANVDTPGYKRKRVAFEDDLLREVNNFQRTGEFNKGLANPRVVTLSEMFKYRLDENNVDIEIEMVSLFENSMKYDTLVGSVAAHHKLLMSVINAR